MHFTHPSLGLAFLVASISQVLALNPKSPLLVPRQACDVACTDYRNATATCTTVTCLCTSAVVASLMSCIHCATVNSPNAIANAIQLATTFQTTCAGLGVDVPIPTDFTRSASSPTDTRTTATAPTPIPTSISQNIIRPSTTEPVDTTNPLGTDGAGLSGGNARVTGGAPSIVAGQGVVILLGVALGVVVVAV
ncbi:hypothetical protein B0H34DRAFT_718975 [Crassisporium funariophilum]|nr:hypothetical protein B0H34DRAFT_718975 [Crassisporium funariophilum]